MLAAVLLPIDNHDAAAAPLLVPLLPAPAAVPVPPSRLERALGPQRAHGRLSPKLGRRRPRHCVADHPAAWLPCLAAASRRRWRGRFCAVHGARYDMLAAEGVGRLGTHVYDVVVDVFSTRCPIEKGVEGV